MNDDAQNTDAQEKPLQDHSGCLPVIGLIVSVLYLANLSAGFIEIPDNLPVVGNLDEVFFSGILFASLAQLGFEIPLLERAMTGRSSKKSSQVSDAGDPSDGS
ncbi:hypothetical protein DTL21_14035 [Bremerella cremea]|uniref:DUF1232 domain-containing protein n=1 Tax=Blastopirellula marina TaxID=124 RepID=A0A2S8FRZ8_9BACT|nr:MULTISPECIES: hypothetical protein [Pirellulaceae]PQO34624.1 hypothetical protein C5Y83_14030 [Blastopirellula marina]RCS47121.1 hypothetical protein DTL21_14035 [Bremerella cremea]